MYNSKVVSLSSYYDHSLCDGMLYRSSIVWDALQNVDFLVVLTLGRGEVWSRAKVQLFWRKHLLIDLSCVFIWVSWHYVYVTVPWCYPVFSAMLPTRWPSWIALFLAKRHLYVSKDLTCSSDVVLFLLGAFLCQMLACVMRPLSTAASYFLLFLNPCVSWSFCSRLVFLSSIHVKKWFPLVKGPCSPEVIELWLSVKRV